MTDLSEGDALKAIDDALSGLDDPARIRVIEWANSKFLGKKPANLLIETPEHTADPAPRRAAKKAKPRAGKKAKITVKQIKNLDLRPDGKKSARSFIGEKNPTNLVEKCTVAVYYLGAELGLEKISADHVYTVFKDAGWPAPTDFLNTLQQAGTKGWLDSANADDLKVTPLGENLIEHDLPKKPAGKSKP